MRILYGLVKFLIGFTLAVAILAGGSVAATLYFVTRLTELPPRPVFENEKPIASSAQSGSGTPVAKQNTQANANSLPPGSYRARVTWPDGLILRDRPSYDATSIGGIEFNKNVIVLEVTSDNEWEKVRVENSNQEGWVKGGNTEKL
jgi:uncharacterized protein YgiM (DUF1202 family)